MARAIVGYFRVLCTRELQFYVDANVFQLPTDSTNDRVQRRACHDQVIVFVEF
jgi:hypothetical protein